MYDSGIERFQGDRPSLLRPSLSGRDDRRALLRANCRRAADQVMRFFILSFFGRPALHPRVRAALSLIARPTIPRWPQRQRKTPRQVALTLCDRLARKTKIAGFDGALDFRSERGCS